MSIFAKTVTKNPLGIIALFIFLIYSIASLVLWVSASVLTSGQKWVFIIFLVIFPLLVLGSFVWLVANHAVKLYSPADFRDDRSYIELNQKVQVIEVKQEAAQVDPRGNIDEAKTMLNKLMFSEQIGTAESVAKAFLKVGRHSESLALFEVIGAHLKRDGRSESKLLSYKSYCLIGLSEYTRAAELLIQLKNSSPEDFDFWPHMALSYCFLKNGKSSESSALLDQAAFGKAAKSYITEVSRRYPELTEKFSSKLENNA